MIRLQRVGRKHEPTFRVVLTDSKNSTKSGRMLETLGSHDPRHKDKTALNVERIKQLIGTGAQLSDTMHNMLVSKKIIEGKKINVLPKKTVPKKEEAPVPKEEAPKAEAKPVEEPAPAEVKTEEAPAA
ncbi:30S ribosomal protein S16 [Candidatus Parcubacteria bacterium]|nr:30S ribosomal protein S16 [Candidatus Parcubacteria bacterium]